MMKKSFKILSLALMFTLFLLGCGGKKESKSETSSTVAKKQSETNASVPKEKVIKIGISKDAAYLNPVLATDLMGESFASNIFDTLVSYKDSVAKPAPGLAEKWEISENGKEYIFHLRKNIKFHNGDPLTSKDVKFTIDSIMDPENASPSKQFFNDVEKIETPDDYTVKFTLKKVYAAFMLVLGSPQIGIIPENYTKSVGMDGLNKKPIGTGPFKFEERVPDDHITLVKNKDYWGGIPNIDKAIFRPIPKAEVMAVELKSGGIDIATDLLSQDVTKFKSDSKYIVKQTPGLSLQYLGFSGIKKPYSDVRFRKAIYYATDFENAIKGIYGDTGERAYSWIPPVVFANDKEYMKSKALPYNEAKAKELFDELKAEGIVKEGMEIPILSPQDAYRSKIATAVASSLIKYGFKPKVQTMEFGTLLPSTEGGKAGIYLLGWGSVPDPDRWTYSIFYSKAGKQNRSMYSNPVVDKALENGRNTVDIDKREKEYVKAMRQALATDYIHIPLIFKNISVAFRPNVKNFEPSPQEYIYLFTPNRNVDITTDM